MSIDPIVPTMNHAAVGPRRRVRCVLGGEEDGLMIFAAHWMKKRSFLRKT